jgi:GWxTD domain-containing protein
MVAALGALGALSACAPRQRVGEPGPEGAPPGAATAPGRRGAPAVLADMATIYQRMGLIAPAGDLPFVGSVAHFATPTGDSTLVLMTLSLSNRALNFVREGDRYRATYQVRLDVRRDGGGSVRQLASDEVVRVATFRETARIDESVLFTQYVTLPPGRYTVAVAVRDAEAGRSSAVDVPLTVPRLGAGALSTPVLAYEVVPRQRLDTLPRLVASPRAAVVFGQDSLVPVYVEAYRGASGSAGVAAGEAPARVSVVATIRGDGGGLPVWRDTASLERRGAPPSSPAAGAPAALALYSGVVRVPVARAGIGVVTLDILAPGGSGGTPGATADSARASLFVSLGDDLPVASFDEMLAYMRYFATPERLRALRDTTPEGRASAWATFLRETDPVSATAQHEGLRDYFARLRTANARFREEASAGWLTDRGVAYIALGEPDQIFDPNGPEQNVRGRTQVWEYREPRVQLVFVDQSGFGRWRLQPASMSEVQVALRRRMVR